VAARRVLDPALPLPRRFRGLLWCIESYAWLTRGGFHATFERLGSLHGFGWSGRLDAEQLEAALRTLVADRERFLHRAEELARRRRAEKAAGVRSPRRGAVEALYAPAAADAPGPPGAEPDPVLRRGVRRAEAARTLCAATELALWDWVWIEAPPPGETGPAAVLALVGSTDLDYYHLARLRFRGVRHSTCPRYFHHPVFRLAPAAAAERLRAGAGAGPESFVAEVWVDAGSPLEECFFVVADAVELETPTPGDGTLRTVYVPANPAHLGWWSDA
ncbi:MAG TPA: hypothetical protein VFQ76_06160, partial [Longimicrobiaceae bacterium]|nr:hypothetical protein [Longimicrobiaceae bacterium]